LPALTPGKTAARWGIEEASKRFFFEKKNQKTFAPEPQAVSPLGPISKSFLVTFFQKSNFFLSDLVASVRSPSINILAQKFNF
jgi:hypothetical protein